MGDGINSLYQYEKVTEANMATQDQLNEALDQRQRLIDSYGAADYREKDNILSQIRTWESTINRLQNQVQTEDRSRLQDTRNKMTDLYNSVNKIYADLVNSGRTEEATQLRDAAERMARSGSQVGVTSEARQSALNDLTSKLRVAGQKAESEMMASKIGQSLNILNAIAGLDKAGMGQGISRISPFAAGKSMVVSPARRTTASRTTTSTGIASPAQRQPTTAASVSPSPATAQAMKLYDFNWPYFKSIAAGNKPGWVVGGGKIPEATPWEKAPETPYMWGERLVPQAPAIGGWGNADNPSMSGGGGNADNPPMSGGGAGSPATRARPYKPRAVFKQGGKTILQTGTQLPFSNQLSPIATNWKMLGWS